MGNTVFAYAAAQITAIFSYGFAVPYLFGICGALDARGRFMAAGAGLQMVGLGLAPWLAGSIMTGWGLPAVAVMVGVVVLVAGVLGLRADSRLPVEAS